MSFMVVPIGQGIDNAGKGPSPLRFPPAAKGGPVRPTLEMQSKSGRWTWSKGHVIGRALLL